MTTIVYDHKARQIAVDSRLCAADKIITDSENKWFVHDGAYWFCSGGTICHDFAKAVFSELKNQWKKYDDNDPSFGYFIVKDSVVWFFITALMAIIRWSVWHTLRVVVVAMNTLWLRLISAKQQKKP